MKNLFLLGILLLSQLSFSVTSNELEVCSMSMEQIETLEAEYDAAKENLENLKGDNLKHMSSTIAALLATGLAAKTMKINQTGPLLAIMLYAIYNASAGYTTYLVNHIDVQNAQEILPYIDLHIKEAKALKELRCTNALEIDNENSGLAIQLEQAIKVLTATQTEIKNALKGQPISLKVKITGASLMALGLVGVIGQFNNTTFIGGALLAILGAITNISGESMAMGAALMDRNELHEQVDNLGEAISRMNEILSSLRKLESLKTKY